MRAYRYLTGIDDAAFCHRVTAARLDDELPRDTIRIELTGEAGQSLGAFLPAGVSITLSGDANDYVGKGMAGGRLVVRPPRGARPPPGDGARAPTAGYGTRGGSGSMHETRDPVEAVLASRRGDRGRAGRGLPPLPRAGEGRGEGRGRPDGSGSAAG
mgnify:CR=1 FL=1